MAKKQKQPPTKSVKTNNKTIDIGDDKNKDIEVIQKKRGRPKKNMVTHHKTPVKIIDKNSNQDEEIILHLSLYDDESESSAKNIFTIDNSDSTCDSLELNPESVVDSSIGNSVNCSMNNSLIGSGKSSKELTKDLKKANIMIKKLKKELEELKNKTFDTGVYASKNTEIKTIDLKLVSIVDNKPVVTTKTDIACWWCTEHFDTIPCHIPDKYNNDTYYVFGCFCTYSCAKAYNSNMNDSRVALRMSLMTKMFSAVFETKEQINMAPPREMLKKFGGILSIDEFRSGALLCKMEYKISLPPFIPLLPVYDEIQKDSFKSQ